MWCIYEDSTMWCILVSDSTMWCSFREDSIIIKHTQLNISSSSLKIITSIIFIKNLQSLEDAIARYKLPVVKVDPHISL